MADVTPKFIILATMHSGNHPFSHVAVADSARGEIFRLNIEGIKEVLEEYKEQFQGKVFIGVRSGFLEREEVEKLSNLKGEGVFFGAINETIDAYVEQLTSQIP